MQSISIKLQIQLRGCGRCQMCSVLCGRCGGGGAGTCVRAALPKTLPVWSGPSSARHGSRVCLYLAQSSPARPAVTIPTPLSVHAVRRGAEEIWLLVTNRSSLLNSFASTPTSK